MATAIDRKRVLDQIRNAAPHLRQTTLQVLADMYSLGELRGTESDNTIAIDEITRIGIEQGAMLNKLMCDHSVKKSLEIGMAYGFSTVWMLDALCSQRTTTHISVDPFQKTIWHGIGLAQTARLGYPGRFEWVPDYSIHALSDLMRQKQLFDFIYIDGNHRFDDVIMDFYLADQITRPEGHIVLDDMWMNSIRTAVSFIINNRAFELVRQPVANITVLRKIRDDDRDWRHFVGFEIHDTSNTSRLQKIKSSLKRKAARFTGAFRKS